LRWVDEAKNSPHAKRCQGVLLLPLKRNDEIEEPLHARKIDRV